MLATIYKVGFVTIIVTFLWEHIGKKTTFPTPSSLLNALANQWEKITTYLGYMWAKISSFLTMIDIKDILDTMFRIWKAIIALIWSNYGLVKGYFDVARRYAPPWVIILGSVILNLGLCVGIWYFHTRIYKFKFLNIIFDKINKFINVTCSLDNNKTDNVQQHLDSDHTVQSSTRCRKNSISQ